MLRSSVILPLLLVGWGCSSSKEEKSNAMATIASGSLAVRAPAPPPSATQQAEPEKPVVKRPKDPADVLLTQERRARVESFAPKTAGFLTSLDLEEKLYKLNLKRGKDDDAIRALDQMAAGKWVLFTGNIGAIGPDGFELPVRYTPKDPNDEMGLTSVWIPVKFSKIEGYSAKEYRPGELAVVVAKYEGNKKAGEGFDLVLLRHWFGE